MFGCESVAASVSDRLNAALSVSSIKTLDRINLSATVRPTLVSRAR